MSKLWIVKDTLRHSNCGLYMSEKIKADVDVFMKGSLKQGTKMNEITKLPEMSKKNRVYECHVIKIRL